MVNRETPTKMASSDEEDLEALRNAALASLWKKREEQIPQGIQVVSTITQLGQPKANPEELQFTSEYDDIPAEVERLFLRQQGRGRGKFQRGRGRGRGGASPSFNSNPNVIVIPTVPLEGEEGQKAERKTFFLRPQDKWGMKETGSASSSPKMRDTSKFRRYDDDSDSEEEDEEKQLQDGENEQKLDEDVDTRNVVLSQSIYKAENAEQSYYENISEVDFRSSELSQTKSDIEAVMEQSLYETVSEVESDVNNENYCRSGDDRGKDKQLDVTKTADQSGLNSSEVQSDVPNSEVLIKDWSLENSTKSANIVAKEKSQLNEKYSNQPSEIIKTDESENSKTEKIKDNITEKITEYNLSIENRSEEAVKRSVNLSPDMTDNDSRLSSSKFNRFNRKRRNTSGSESDGSGYSDVSSWSASRQSPFEFSNKPHNNAQSDVSSTPFPDESASEKEMSGKESESEESDSESDSSSSSDEASLSSVSSVELPVKELEKTPLKTKSFLLAAEKNKTNKEKIGTQRENIIRSPELRSKEIESNKTEFKQMVDKACKKEEIFSKREEKSLKSATVKSEKTKEHESDRKKVTVDTYMHESTQDKISKEQTKVITDKTKPKDFKTEKTKYKDEKSKQIANESIKSNNNSQVRQKEKDATKHFEEISLISGKENDKYKKEQVKQLFPIKLDENYSKRGMEQLVQDARKQELEKFGKEIRTVSLAGSVPKDKPESKSQSTTDLHKSKSDDSVNSHSKSYSIKDKIAASSQHEETSRHEKSSKHRRSKSRTPPKAYLKAINKKTEQKVIKRLGSLSPPKAYSKDLKKVEKRRKSNHSGDRKRKQSGSAKKNRKSDSLRRDSDTDSDKSISSLSDSDSNSETENWRDKKSGVSRKLDDIERERRIRLAAERENRKKERKDNSSSKDSKDREHNDRRYSGRIDERDRKSKVEIDSFDARDYRQHKNWDDRSRARRDFADRRHNEKVFFRRNKTFVEEEPLMSKSNYFEEEVSDDSHHNDKKGVVSVIKTNRKRLSSEADLEDIKISTKHQKRKHEDLNEKVKKERLIISVQESSGDEKETKPAKVKKKRKTKHKTHEKNPSKEMDVKEQTVKVIFDKEEDKPRKSVYDRLGVPVTKPKNSAKPDGPSKSKREKDKSIRSKGKDHSKDRDHKHGSRSQKHGNREEGSGDQSPAIRRVYREEEKGKTKTALNVKIQKIHEKNAEIMRRRKEIEQDRQKYG